MLNLNPDKRLTAEQMLAHEWLQGVIVQGEIDVHLANEAKEEERARIEEGKATAQEIGMDVESPGVVNGAFLSSCFLVLRGRAVSHRFRSLTPLSLSFSPSQLP
jgi:hypothetical protein